MSLFNASQSLNHIKLMAINALNSAADDRKSALRFISLCTIKDIEPNTRYVVLRAFSTEDYRLLIYTDYRSQKIQEIRANPVVTCLAYDEGRHFQLKLRGKASIHVQDELAIKHWHELKGGKEAYQTMNPPSTVAASLAEAQQIDPQVEDKHFTVIAIQINKMEVLQLADGGHIRALFDFESYEQYFLVP